MVLSRCRRCALLHGFVVACWCIIVPPSCRVVVPRRLVVSEGGWSESAMTHQTGMMNDDQCRRSSFGCHVAISNVAPGILHGHLGLWAVVWVHGRPLAFVGGRGRRTSLWALGAMWWLLSAASSCGGCGGWMKKRGMSHVVTLV